MVAAQSAFFAVNNPARSAIVPRLIEPALLPAANALSTLTFGAGFMIGPLLGGARHRRLGLTATYAIDALLFGAAMYGVFRLPSIPPEAQNRTAPAGPLCGRGCGSCRPAATC